MTNVPSAPAPPPISAPSEEVPGLRATSAPDGRVWQLGIASRPAVDRGGDDRWAHEHAGIPLMIAEAVRLIW